MVVTKRNKAVLEKIEKLHSDGVLRHADYFSLCEMLDGVETLDERDAMLEKLWEEFGDIPMDDETECMEAPFLDFPAGTYREGIWHWFDERHSKGVPYLLYGGAEDYVSEAHRLYKLRKKCLECESKDCCFNHGGECRLPLIHEREPRISEEDGCTDYTCKEGK